jgi:hypothetical protein
MMTAGLDGTEPLSDTVQTLIAAGVSMKASQLLALSENAQEVLPADGLGEYKDVSEISCLFIHLSIL